jgi:hypothetical protein
MLPANGPLTILLRWLAICKTNGQYEISRLDTLFLRGTNISRPVEPFPLAEITSLSKGFLVLRHSILPLFLCLLLQGLSGCQSEPSSTIVVAISSEVPVPDGIDEIDIKIESESEIKFAQSYPVGPNHETNIPGTLTIANESQLTAKQPIHLTIRARQNGKGDRVVRKAVLAFSEGKQKLLRMPLTFSCLDFDQTCGPNQTCKAGRCESDYISVDSLKEYESNTVFGESGDGNCFDRDACVPAASTLEITDMFRDSTDSERCTITINDIQTRQLSSPNPSPPARVSKINFGFVWASYPGTVKRWTAVNFDKEEGWSVNPNNPSEIQLAPGLCQAVRSKDAQGNFKIDKAIVNPSCAPKRLAQPECQTP